MLRTLLSVLAAMFGVQSRKNYEHDLQSGKLAHFIVAGVICLLGFILVVYCVVRYVLIKNGF